MGLRSLDYDRQAAEIRRDENRRKIPACLLEDRSFLLEEL